MSSSSRGRFVVFEGLDGAGTSTQIEVLAGWLRTRGTAVDTTREPTGGAIGRLIREVLTGARDADPATLALLFAADRLDHLNGVGGVNAALDAGHWVLSDRYVLSSIAYQAAEGLDAGWVAELNRGAFAPDLTVFIDTEPEVCMQRIEARGGKPERFETLERLMTVLGHFRSHFQDHRFTGDLLVVDGNGSIEAVAAEVQSAVDTWMSKG